MKLLDTYMTRYMGEFFGDEFTSRVVKEAMCRAPNPSVGFVLLMVCRELKLQNDGLARELVELKREKKIHD